MPLCIYQPSCISPPANVYSQLERHSLCADVQSQVKTLRSAFPSNFLACPSLNIDIAPQLRCLILLRIERAQLTVGSNDIFWHSCAFFPLLFAGRRLDSLVCTSPAHPPPPTAHPPPYCSPRKLSTQRQGKVFCKPLRAAPTVVTATHNRLHRHGVGGGERQTVGWPVNSPGATSAQGASISPFSGPPAPHHCPSKKKSPLCGAAPTPPRRGQPAKGACCTFSQFQVRGAAVRALLEISSARLWCEGARPRTEARAAPRTARSRNSLLGSCRPRGAARASPLHATRWGRGGGGSRAAAPRSFVP